MYPKWERGYIVGEMREANFLFYNIFIVKDFTKYKLK